jgi:signal transduction histidine kinase/CheY-like chemotaxis protein
MPGMAVDTVGFMSLSPPEAGDKQLALAVLIVSGVVFAATAPFAKVMLAQVDAFIPAYQAAFVVNELITASLLFGQYRVLRAPKLAILGAGYFFTALIAMVHALTFPGAFADSGLLGGGSQTTAWLYMLWHAGFPLYVIAYALLGDGPNIRVTATRALAFTALLVCVMLMVVTLGHNRLPRMMADNATTWTLTIVVSLVLAINVVALVFVYRRRERSALDLWLCVVTVVWICEIGLSSLLDAARFDLGFYLGRIYGLAASCFVLLVLIQDINTRQWHLAMGKRELNLRAQGLERDLQWHGVALQQSSAALEASELDVRRKALNLTTLIENLPFGLTLVGPDLRIHAFNRKFTELFGLAAPDFTIGYPFEKFVRSMAEKGEYGPGDPETLIRERLAKLSDRSRAKFERERPDGTTLEIHHIPLSDGSFVYAYFDISDRKKRLQQAVRAQKLEAVGSLTGGIAHDFNNMLTVMIGNLDFLRLHLRDDTAGQEYVTDAMHAARQAADLTRQLLAFAKQQTLEPKSVDIGGLLYNVVKLLRRTLGDNIEIRSIASPSLWNALIDEGQLEAAIVNLAVNARDAMPNGGDLVIEARNEILEADYAAAQTDVKPGDYVLIEVTDSGTGIPPENLPRIFEPFFSTKEDFRGTGLGLAMVYGFVKQSGGHISVYSEMGKGTTFRLYMPRVPDKFVRASSADRQAVASAPPTPGGATILVVDDNPSVRSITIRQLEGLGYSVLAAANGTEALATFAREPGIDLVLSDISMPGGKSGWDIVREVRARRPTVRCLLMSGFPAAMTGEKSDDGVQVLRKPFQRDELSRRIRAVLAGPA